MPDPQATTTMVSLKKELDGARELRGLILRHRANVLTRRASWRNLLWKPWQASASSGRWFPPAPGARNGRGVVSGGPDVARPASRQFHMTRSSRGQSRIRLAGWCN
jgi:hypothetical protein